MKAPFVSISSLAALLLVSPLAADSLWLAASNDEAGLYADHRAGRVGDIVTVVVSESSSMVDSITLTTSKDSSIAQDLQRLIFPEVLRYDGETPSTNFTIDNSHSGSGARNSSQRLTARITVQVIDVLPNGNLVLEGVRRLRYGGETYYMLTNGICRSVDVAPDNTVASSSLADARIEIIAEGTLTESQRKGWLTRWADRFSP